MSANKVDAVSDSVTRRGRRPGVKLYPQNPFFSQALDSMRVVSKRVNHKSTGDQRYMVMNMNGGELVAPVGFHHVRQVDATKFVKLYAQGVREFSGLSSAGAKMFEVLYLLISEKLGQDRIWLHYLDLKGTAHENVGERTFQRGLRNLLDLRFLAESDRPGMYWLNVSFMFNGDRFAFFNEIVKSNPSEKQPDQTKREALEAAGQQRLLGDEK